MCSFNFFVTAVGYLYSPGFKYGLKVLTFAFVLGFFVFFFCFLPAFTILEYRLFGLGERGVGLQCFGAQIRKKEGEKVGKMYVAKSYNISRRLFKERVPYKYGSGYTYLAKGKERVRFEGVKKLTVNGEEFASLKTVGMVLPKVVEVNLGKKWLRVELPMRDDSEAKGYSFTDTLGASKFASYELFEEFYDDFELMNCGPHFDFPLTNANGSITLTFRDQSREKGLAVCEEFMKRVGIAGSDYDSILSEAFTVADKNNYYNIDKDLKPTWSVPKLLTTKANANVMICPMLSTVKYSGIYGQPGFISDDCMAEYFDDTDMNTTHYSSHEFYFKQIDFEDTYANFIYSCDFIPIYYLSITAPKLGITLVKTNIAQWETVTAIKPRASDKGSIIRASVMPFDRQYLETHEMVLELKAGDLVTALNDDNKNPYCDISIIDSGVTDIGKYLAN